MFPKLSDEASVNVVAKSNEKKSRSIKDDLAFPNGLGTGSVRRAKMPILAVHPSTHCKSWVFVWSRAQLVFFVVPDKVPRLAFHSAENESE